MSADEYELSCDTVAPRVSDLVDEYRRCSPETEAWNRSSDAERVRFALWDNQSSDGRKRSTGEEKAKPWEGASDLRVFLADDIVNEEVAVCSMAFWRSLLRTEGVQADDAGSAAVLTRMLHWLVKNKLSVDLLREVELSAQYQRTYGWTALHVTWVREIGRRMETVSLETLARLSPDLAQAVVDPLREEEVIGMLGMAYDAWARKTADSLGIDSIPALSQKRIRRALRDLRAEGKAELPVPMVVKNQPSIEALRPWSDVFIPDEIGDAQRGRVYVRQWFRDEELKAKVVTDGWDEAWVEEAIKTKGMQTVWASDLVTQHFQVIQNKDDPWIEVVTAYTRRVDEDGVPGTYVTVFSPHVTKEHGKESELCASHGQLDFAHGKIPIVVGVREWVCRSIAASRGVPEQAAPSQRLEKVMADALIDRTSLTTLPPRIVPSRLMDEDQEFGPGATIPIMRGEEPRFMDTPARDGVAEEILRLTQQRTDQSFARLSNEVPPARVQVRQQHMVNGFLGMWTEAFRQAVALLLQYQSPAEFQRITGFPKPQWGAEEIAGLYDIILTMDVRELDSEFAVKQLEAVSKYVLPEDSAGVVDRSKLVRAKLQAINPLLARDLVSDQAGAQQKLFRDVSAEIASMFLGNPPQLVENDPTAPIQLQFAAQILQNNPNYQAALGQQGRFSELMQVWAKNRMQSKVQQENKVVGRLGVQPMQSTPQ